MRIFFIFVIVLLIDLIGLIIGFVVLIWILKLVVVYLFLFVINWIVVDVWLFIKDEEVFIFVIFYFCFWMVKVIFNGWFKFLNVLFVFKFLLLL